MTGGYELDAHWHPYKDYLRNEQGYNNSNLVCRVIVASISLPMMKSQKKVCSLFKVT